MLQYILDAAEAQIYVKNKLLIFLQKTTHITAVLFPVKFRLFTYQDIISCSIHINKKFKNALKY